MLTHWTERDVSDLLAAHGLAGIPEEPFPNDGWSGAVLTQVRRGHTSYIVKRTSWAQDWIARATRDHALREGFVAGGQLPLPTAIVAPYLGAGADGTAVAMLMPDLSAELITWERTDGTASVTATTLDRLLVALTRLHATGLPAQEAVGGDRPWPWCPLRERLTLLSRSSAEQFRTDGVIAGERFITGWDAFDRLAPAAARDLIGQLADDPSPLLAALDQLPDALLHGDLKVANVAMLADGRIALIDWQMVMRAPVAVELGWFLVSNSGALAAPADEVLDRYLRVAQQAGDVPLGDVDAQRDLSWLVGLLLRGWRKGLDAAGRLSLPSGASAIDDLELWCDRAVEAAARRL